MEQEKKEKEDATALLRMLAPLMGCTVLPCYHQTRLPELDLFVSTYKYQYASFDHRPGHIFCGTDVMGLEPDGSGDGSARWHVNYPVESSEGGLLEAHQDVVNRLRDGRLVVRK